MCILGGSLGISHPTSGASRLHGSWVQKPDFVYEIKGKTCIILVLLTLILQEFLWADAHSPLFLQDILMI